MKKLSKDFHYLTNCVNSTYEAITALQESAKEISYRTFIQHVNVDELKSLFPAYSWNGRGWLHIKDDFEVSWYKGRYEGKECYFIEHSCIEYIFVRDREED